MSRSLLFLGLFTALTLSSTAKADLIIDDFNGGNFNLTSLGGTSATTGVNALSTDVTGNFEYTVTGTPFANLTGGTGVLNASATSLGDTFRLSYTSLPNIDLHSVGAFDASPLIMTNFASVNGTFSLVATYTSGATSMSFAPVTVDSATTSVAIDGTTLGNGALASSVTGLDFLFTVTGLNAGAATFALSPGSIAATPEPMSMLLLGITGIGGGVIYRRRRRTTPMTGTESLEMAS